MTRHRTYLLISASVYAGFGLVVVWAVGFLAGLGPTSVDGPVRLPTSPAVLVDLGLLGLFALQHSVMARRSVKEKVRHWCPADLERSAYVLATVGCLVAAFALWQPLDGWTWRASGPTAALLWVGYVAGWALALTATFLVDHADFVGLRQAGWRDPRGAAAAPPVVERGLYGLTRHPMMLGLLVAFWVTPTMSTGHLLFAVAASGYIAVGVHFEERDLRHDLGPVYDAYARRVPALVPGLRRRSPTLSPDRGRDG